MSNKKLPKYAKYFKNHKVIVFADGSMTHHQVIGIDKGTIETEEGMLREEDAVKYYDNNHGGFTYLFNLDLPAKVESQNLKDLRRSVAINNLFNYDREKAPDIFKMILWLALIIAIIK